MRALRAISAGLLVALSAACAARMEPAPPPSIAPRFPEFVFPGAPEGLGTPAAIERHALAWRWLQAGDFRAAERNFEAALKQSPDFYPAHAGLGWVALARKDEKDALTYFDRAVVANPRYAPALVGRGHALTTLGDDELALKSLEAAVAADPALDSLNNRIEVLRFNTVKERIAAARKASESGRLGVARAEYEKALVASPDSPFLYRELAMIERREGDLDAALAHAQKAAELEQGDPRNLILIAEIYEAQGQMTRAADTYANANALEPSEALEAKIEELREKAAFAVMPAEYQAIEQAPTVSRAQLAALLGVRLDDLLKRSTRRTAVLITDMRGSWAAPWILAVTRAGLMEVYPNHTFQPQGTVRRADLAHAAARALAMIGAENPRLAASWKNPRRKFPDVSPGHLSHGAASIAVEAGVMAPLPPDGSFHLSRPVTGAEAVAAVRKLQALSERRRR